MKRKMLFIVLLSLISFVFLSMPLETKNIDLTRYQGTWYEIARFGLFWERSLVNVTAEYTLRDDGKITVVNQGFLKTPEGLKSSVKGLAWVPDKEQTGKLMVQFFSSFSSDYWVVVLDEDNYSYAVVTQPQMNFLWILSRTPKISDDLKDMLLKEIVALGFDISKLEFVLQDWE